MAALYLKDVEEGSIPSLPVYFHFGKSIPSLASESTYSRFWHIMKTR